MGRPPKPSTGDVLPVERPTETTELLERPERTANTESRKRWLIASLLGVGTICGLIAIWAVPHRRDEGPVHWTPCEEDRNMFCTFFEVPTDYDDPSVGTTRLAMTKLPATRSPRLGSVMTNYGGPGALGYSMSFTLGKNNLHHYAPNYDLISWDPRGMGRTIPAVDCYGDGLLAMLAKAGTTHEETMDVPPDPWSVGGTAKMVEQQRDAMALMKLQADKCAERMGGDALQYSGTTTLIRDIERIAAVLDGPEADINFIGGSYGAIVAAYLVNMLPHKVGRVFTVGVADAPGWANHHYEDLNLLTDFLTDAEKTYDWFLRDCHSAGGDCALYQPSDASAEDIKGRIDQFMLDLYRAPMSVPDAARPGLLKSGMIRQFIYGILQFAGSWAGAAQVLAEAMNGNGTYLRNGFVPAYDPTPAHDGWVYNNQADLTRLAVACADSPPYREDEAWPTPEQTVEKLQRILQDVSPMFGGTVHLMEQHGGCQFWPRAEHPIERFTGPWNATLKNPIIIGSNTHDPVTPRVSGRRMADRLGKHGARHFVQEVPGHSYLTPPVSSYLEAIQAYFANGTLPEEFETFYPAEGRNYIKSSRADSAPEMQMQDVLPLPGRLGLL